MRYIYLEWVDTFSVIDYTFKIRVRQKQPRWTDRLLLKWVD